MSEPRPLRALTLRILALGTIAPVLLIGHLVPRMSAGGLVAFLVALALSVAGEWAERRMARERGRLLGLEQARRAVLASATPGFTAAAMNFNEGVDAAFGAISEEIRRG